VHNFDTAWPGARTPSTNVGIARTTEPRVLVWKSRIDTSVPETHNARRIMGSDGKPSDSPEATTNGAAGESRERKPTKPPVEVEDKILKAAITWLAPGESSATSDDEDKVVKAAITWLSLPMAGESDDKPEPEPPVKAETATTAPEPEEKKSELEDIDEGEDVVNAAVVVQKRIRARQQAAAKNEEAVDKPIAKPPPKPAAAKPTKAPVKVATDNKETTNQATARSDADKPIAKTPPKPTAAKPTKAPVKVAARKDGANDHVSTVTADRSRNKTNDLRLQLQKLRERTHNTVSQLNEEIEYLSSQLEITRERLLSEQAAKSQVQQRLGLGESREQTLHDTLRESRHKHELTLATQRAQEQQIQDVCRALQVDVLAQVAPYCLNLKQRTAVAEEEVRTLRAGVQFHMAECDGLRHANHALQGQMKLLREQKKHADLSALEARNAAEDVGARAHDAKVNVHALRRRSEYLSDVVMLYSGSGGGGEGGGGGGGGTGSAFLAPHMISSARNHHHQQPIPPPPGVHAPNTLPFGNRAGFYANQSPRRVLDTSSPNSPSHQRPLATQPLHSSSPLPQRKPERPNSSRSREASSTTPRERLQHKRIEFGSPNSHHAHGGGSGSGGSGRGSGGRGRGRGRGANGAVAMRGSGRGIARNGHVSNGRTAGTGNAGRSTMR
jgi:hypothetical protein